MPALWLSPNFPLKIEEFLPLLDILAEKVKAVRRVRELLTTKLPKDTFPVKVCTLFGLLWFLHFTNIIDLLAFSLVLLMLPLSFQVSNIIYGI
jgi:hypothetical protein